LEQPGSPPASGLRERKKARTRSAIQREALRLFGEHGYDQTTVEQICAAAEVSESTFYRYFPTKEDVALHDRYDPLLIAAFHAQPAELSPVEALRAAMHGVFDRLPESELAAERARVAVIVSVPAVRARMLDQLSESIQLLVVLLAERTGRTPDDFAVRNFAGALFGIAVAAMLAAADDPEADYLQLFYAGLAHLEAGLPL
jgi:AcrR family transcriptional regulator